MKQKILIFLTAIGGILGITSRAKATSTVLLDPPNIGEMIGSIYDIAQPLFNSVSGWIWVFLAFSFVFFVVRLLLGLFNR